MKAKVIMPFKDKVTNKVMKPNMEFDTTEKRFAEINKTGRYVVEVKEAAKPEETK